MKAHVLKGSKQQIIGELQNLDGEIHEAIVLMEEPAPSVPRHDLPNETVEDMFAEMKEWEVHESSEVDYSREASTSGGPVSDFTRHEYFGPLDPFGGFSPPCGSPRGACLVPSR